MNRNKIALCKILALALILVAVLPSCQKMYRPPLVIIPDDTAKLNGPLQRMFWFEESPIDSIYYEKGVASNVTYVDGINGKAYKGASNAMIVLPGGGPKVSTMTSFTVAFWINTNKHTGGAQTVFVLGRNSDFWGNLFCMIEGNGDANDNSMLVKFHFAGNWVEFTGSGSNPARIPDMYGKWKHLAFRYDETTSKFSAFVDGVKYALSPAVEDRMRNGAPLGKLAFVDPSKLVIGGFQQHAGVFSNSPDSWMQRYTGMLDQLRIYTTPISDAEIAALFTNKR